MEINVIKAIADKYGENILLEGKKLSGLIADYIPGDKKARNLLNTAVREKIPQKLYDMKSMDKADREMRIKGLCIRFMDENSLTEQAAFETISLFASAFGYLGHTESKIPSVNKLNKVNIVNVVNIDGNQSYLGEKMQHGDYVYYRNEDDNCTLYKIHTDGSGKTKLNNDRSYSINVSHGWIYYCNQSDGEKLYKIRTDGSSRAKLNDDTSLFISVSNGWVYYSNWSDGEKLYKIRTDGSGKTKLNNDECQNINIVDNWVYYTNWSDSKKRYRIRTNGSQRQIAEPTQ